MADAVVETAPIHVCVTWVTQAVSVKQVGKAIVLTVRRVESGLVFNTFTGVLSWLLIHSLELTPC